MRAGAARSRRVKVRSSIPCVLVLTLVAQTPSAAHAQARESAEAPAAEAAGSTAAQWGMHAPPPIDLRVDGVWRTGSVANAPMGAWFAPKPAPIRLSQTAITAIIIGGVVLVVLVVAGVAVIGKPGKIR
jgi:hypothetical protein